MEYIKINDSASYEVEQAYIRNGDLFVVLDMQYQDAVEAFQGAESVTFLDGYEGNATGRYPDVEFQRAAYGGGPQEGEEPADGSQARDVSTVQLHILTKMEAKMRNVERVLMQHDLAFAELYRG